MFLFVVGMDSKIRAKRSYITKRPSLPKEVLEEAVQTVLDKKMSIRGAAHQFNMAKSVLARFVVRAKSEPNNSFIYEPKNRNRNRIFTNKEEENLILCLNLISKTTQVLTYQKIREFVFHYAIKLGKEALPKNWTDQKKAGMDWTKVFMNRHQIVLVHHQKDICIYKPRDFVVVKTESAGYSVGEVIQIISKKKITVKLLEKVADSYCFVYPEYEDLIDIDTLDIFLKLIKPEIEETNAEKLNLSFNFDLSHFL